MSHRDGNRGLVFKTSARGTEGGKMVEKNGFVEGLGAKKDGKWGKRREGICSRHDALTNTWG